MDPNRSRPSQPRAGPSQPRRSANAASTTSKRHDPESNSLSERSNFARKSARGPAPSNPAAIAFARLQAEAHLSLLQPIDSHPEAEEARMEEESARPPQTPSTGIRISKQTSHAARFTQQRTPPTEAGREPHRPTMRKPGTAPSGPSLAAGQKTHQSSFPYITPLLRATARPTKSVPVPLPHLAAQEEREKRARKDDGTYSLGTRSAPRMSLASMSVQRRVGQSPRKSIVRAPAPAARAGANAFPEAEMHVNRKGEVVLGSSESDSEKEASSSSSDEDGDAPSRRRPDLAGRTARKTLPQGVRKLAKAARKLAVEDRPEEQSPLRRKARKREVVGASSEESDRASGDVIELTESSSDEDIDKLLDAFDALTLTAARLKQRRRLPFLLRNLRMGFESRCRTFRVPIDPEDFPRLPVKVVYRYAVDDSDREDSDESAPGNERKYQEFLGSLTKWACPLCELHKPFRNRRMLAYHLTKDHVEVKVSWVERKLRTETLWRIDLVLPDADELEDDVSDDSEDRESDSEQRLDAVHEDEVVQMGMGTPRPLERTPTQRSDPLFLPGSDEETPPQSVTPPPLPADQEFEDVKPSYTPPPPRVVKRRTSPKPAGRPSLTTATRQSYRGSLPARYPSPPPKDDPLGPAAQYPYLPEETPDGQKPYSCRISGPRIFDLLTILPTDEFGVMSWEIVHREEELFEMEDMRDEDKVMLALWNRWIMPNRVDFIFHDYCDGVIKFIEKYWEIIHQAAGWRALRAFLIMLCMNRYLKFEQILKVLKHYESKTGMGLWYKDAEACGVEGS